jgi:hypothetical protein
MMPRDRYIVRSTATPKMQPRQIALFDDCVTLRRVWYPYDQWEEYHAGMWRLVHASAEHDALLAQAIRFTGDAPRYGEAMTAVVHAWPISCAMNLTTLGMNRHAWIGHAACAHAFGCPEHIVREAWHLLTQQQQDDANEQANTAIELWERTYGASFQ